MTSERHQMLAGLDSRNFAAPIRQILAGIAAHAIGAPIARVLTQPKSRRDMWSALRQTREKPSVPRSSPRGLIPSSSTSISSRHTPCPKDPGGAWKTGVAGLARSHECRAVRIAGFYRFAGRAPAEHHASGIIIAPSLAYMERAYSDARTFGWSRRTIIELVIPSTLDGTLAPRGQHVASLFCQHVAPKRSDGSSWDDHRETVADLMIETVNDHAPTACPKAQTGSAEDKEECRAENRERPYWSLSASFANHSAL